MAAKHVFLSYAREDKKVAREVGRRLKRSRITTWQDLNDLKGGVSWQTTIDDALRSASALIVVMSPHAATSPYVTYEWAFALGAGVQVIPVVVHDADLHPRLSTIQYIDFTKRKAWVLLWKALPFVRRHVRRRAPGIHAEFDTTNGVPTKTDSGYIVRLSIDGVPRNARAVVYEVYDETMSRLKWASTNVATRFQTSFQCDGDVLVTANLQTATKTISLSTSLFEALRKTHRRTMQPAVRHALQDIGEN